MNQIQMDTSTLNPIMIQEGPRIYLRLMTLEDTEDIIRWRNSDRVKSNFIYQRPFTKEGHLKWIETMINTGEAIQFMICLKENNRSLGSVYFREIDHQHNKAEYGIFIGEADAAGCGIGTEAAKVALDYAFQKMKLHKVFLRALSDNGQALRSYEKAGFKKEAYLCDDVCINGVYHDIILMGIINPMDNVCENPQISEPNVNIPNSNEKE
jgi:UDP-4-amino-4,6-dideoxy-N-acetyl-beta-L-altrosamine N-acetyltransferase